MVRYDITPCAYGYLNSTHPCSVGLTIIMAGIYFGVRSTANVDMYYWKGLLAVRQVDGIVSLHIFGRDFSAETPAGIW